MKPSALALRGASLAFALALALPAFAASPAFQIPEFNYQQHNLVSDGAVAADHVDPNLVNPWGIAFNPFGPVWLADNGTGLSTLYDGAGVVQSLVVEIPAPGSDSGGTPSGTVYNGSQSFKVSKGALSGPSVFLFVTEDGVIAGWAPNVDSTHAITAIDNSTYGAVYKGVAITGAGNGGLLYATDFHNAKVDVYDANFQPVALSGSAFRDAQIPTGYAPFGIQNINGDLYVTYAKQDADKHDDVPGPGFGYVDIYDPNGVLLRRFASRGALNAPWGVALAPAGFGHASNTLLIGNFGDGRINAYAPTLGVSLGSLKDSSGHPISIDGLWGLAFGNGYSSQSVNTLYFTAGPNGEADGLYGRIDPVK